MRDPKVINPPNFDQKAAWEEMKEKKWHSESCIECRHSWYHEESYGEVVYDGPSGWVCDGRSKGNVVNLRSFPFKTKQHCFESKQVNVEFT